LSLTINGFCIDKYEAYPQNSNGSDATPPASAADTDTLLAAGGKAGSALNKTVWVYIDQTEARTACSNAGKHLCTDEEWLAAANMQGQVYNLPTNLAVSPYYCVTDSSTYCLDNSPGNGEACQTGCNKNGCPSGCYSSEGVYDQTGNVWEWTNETVDVTNPDGVAGWKYPNSTQGWQTTTGAETAIYGNDGIYFPLTTTGRAVIRGGLWSDGALAGPFCAYLGLAPSSTYYSVGFRCCSS
jgi:formylglycine-generating enzyme required for sulfatase activity